MYNVFCIVVQVTDHINYNYTFILRAECWNLLVEGVSVTYSFNGIGRSYCKTVTQSLLYTGVVWVQSPYSLATRFSYPNLHQHSTLKNKSTGIYKYSLLTLKLCWILCQHWDLHMTHHSQWPVRKKSFKCIKTNLCV